MDFASILLLLLPIAAVAYIVWNYRRRGEAREAAKAERLQAFMGAAQSAKSATGPIQAPSAGRGEPGRPLISYSARDRLLTPPQTLLYYLLRSALPDHVIFSHMTLASVLDTATGVAEHARPEMARRLLEHRIDFVIADRRMRTVAVIRLLDPADGPRTSVSSAERWIAEAGIRFVQLDARALPRKEAIRAVVLGDSGTESAEKSAAVS